MVKKVTKRVTKKLSKAIDPKSEDFVEFVLSNDAGVSSSSMVRVVEGVKHSAEAGQQTAVELDADAMASEKYSPAFLELAVPKLPALPRENRAKLLMQSPNRLYFYWGVGKNPFHTLNRAIGETGSYTLVLKLTNLKNDTELIHAIDEAGSWWFDVEADTEYRAEIGFYATNRPYVRIMFSNTIATPRKSPSPRSADSAQWMVSADKFARVLDIAGFSRDAFDVALAGDDWDASAVATMSAFSQFTGKPRTDFAEIGADEIRFAMLALAAGHPLSSLRGRISAALYALLEASIAGLSSEDALAALKTQFDFEADDIEEEELGSAVFGASLVNFPRKLKRKGKLSELAPFSSFSIAKTE